MKTHVLGVWVVAWMGGLAGGLLGGSVAEAQTDIDFVTVGSPGNPAYRGPDPFDRVTGRGSVGYEYRIGRTEVTTAQWMEFYNTFKARADAVPDSVLPVPIIWGAVRDPNYTGPGVRYMLNPNNPYAGDMPAYNVTWRTAARFCNWQHNDRSSDLSAIANGAYDTSTFVDFNENRQFTDQATRSPGARFWIPSLDEWMKASHWSPSNPNLDGWYLGPNRSDQPLMYGPPGLLGGMGQANAGFTLPNFAHYTTIPLGAYPEIFSPWGLLDSAGAGAEWLEEILSIGGDMYRGFDSSNAGMAADGAASRDAVHGWAADRPWARAIPTGLRIASSIPTPGVSGMLILAIASCVVGRHRGRPEHVQAVHLGVVRGGGGPC